MKKIYVLFVLLFLIIESGFAQEGLANYTTTRNTGITYTSISGTGLSPAFWRNGVNTDDNMSEAIPIGFNFLFDGVNNGFVQITTSGHVNLLTNSGALGNGTGAYGYQNTTFSTSGSTVRDLAVFFDDQQTAGNLGTLADLQASMKYQLSGIVGSRVFTIEWINMQDFATGSTASLNYQIQLFEGTNDIKFVYGNMTNGNAPAWTYTCGLNSRTLTATPTASQLWSQQTVNTNTFAATASNALAVLPATNTEIVFTSTAAARVPLSGTYTVPGSFSTVKAAIDALNYNGTAGAVILNLSSGSTFTEDLPPLQTGIFGDAITIQKSGAGANPIIRPTGTLAGTADFGFRMFGVDNLTWDGIDIGSNGANVEFGLFLSQLSDKNGCQNNTFRNFNITLNRTGTVSQVGILTNSVSQPALSAAGANTSNTFKNFGIRNIAGTGVQFNGAVSGTYNAIVQTIFLDNNNLITNDVCTNFNIIGDPATPNDFIPVTTSGAFGIFNLGQRDMTISNCSISNLTTSSTGSVQAIIVNGSSTAQMPSATFYSQGVLSVFNNKVATLRANNTGAGIVAGIRANINGNAGSFIRIYNNFISDLSSTSTVITSRRIVGIQLQDAGTGAGSAIEVWHNSVSLNPAGILCPNTCLEAYTNTTGPVLTVRNNIFANFTVAQAGSAKHYNIVSNSTTLFGNTGSVSNNNDLFNAGTTNGFTGLGSATDYTTIANWTAANTQDAASITVNPNFAGPTDLHISALGLNNSGTTAPAYVTNDIDCETRPLPAATNFDMGADEINACAGTPTSGIITALANPVCSGIGTTLSTTGSSTGAGISHGWGFSTTPGGPYTALGTAASQATSPLTVTTYYIDTVKCATSGQNAITAEFTVNVNPLPVVTVSPTSATFCSPSGTPVALLANGANTYSWSPAAGLSATNIANPTASPTINTTYIVTGTVTATGCFSTASTTITVNPSPTISSTTATPAAVCSGSNSQLNVNATATCFSVIITELSGFETGTGGGTIPFTGASDPIELTNVSTTAVDISGWRLEITGTSPGVFIIPAGNVVPAGATFVISRGSTGPADIPGVFVKSALATTASSTSQSFILSNGGVIVDVATINGGTPHNPIGTGTPVVTATDWTASSPGSTSGLGGLRRTVATDNNNASDWTVSSAGNLTNFGTINTAFTTVTCGTLSYLWSPSTFIVGQEALQNPLATAVTAQQAYSVLVTSTNGCTVTSNVTVNLATYTGAPVTQPFITPVTVGSSNNQILLIDLPQACVAQNLTQLDFTNNSTAVSDISNARVFYGTTNVFASATQIGATANPGSTFSVTTNQLLSTSTRNYLWLVYDISCAAVNNNLADGGVTNVVIGGNNFVPSPANPVGTRTINTTTNYTTVANGEWSNAATWACGAIPPSNTTPVVIANAITVSDAVGNIAGNVTINSGSSLTINTGGLLTLGTVGGGNSVLTNNGTLAVTGGVLNQNGSILINNTSNFSQSAGLISVDGNSGSAVTSVITGTPIFAIGTVGTNYATGIINLTGGKLQIVDPHAATGQAFIYYGFAISNNVTTGPGHILELGDGVSTTSGGTTSGFVLNQWESIGGFKPDLLVINTATGTNRNVTSPYNYGFRNLSVLSGDFLAPGNTNIDGNITVTNPGSLTTTGIINLTGNTFAGGAFTLSSATNSQSLSGTGIYRNLATSPTANVTSLSINNSSLGGVTLNTPISISGTLTLTAGRINTTASNILTLGFDATNVGTLSYTAGNIVGPFKRWIAAATGATRFPVGNGTNLKDANINFTVAPTAGTLTARWSTIAPDFPNSPTLVESGIALSRASTQGSWFIDGADGLAGGTYTSIFTANGSTDVIDYTRLVLVKRPSTGGNWTLDGTHTTSTGTNTAPILSRIGMAGFSEFALGGELNVSLPVSIEYLKGSKQSFGNLLDWKVNCTSAPSVVMELERSVDGRRFNAIKIESATAARCQQGFNYIDAMPLAGINYYRLKITDPIGAFRYSNIIAILNKDKGFELISIAPNPVIESAILTLSSAKAGKVDIVISDVAGKVIAKQINTVIAGSNPISMNFSKLGAGTYAVTVVNADGETKTTRFVKY